MRKFLISLLLASAIATPALADPDRNDHQNARAERAAPHGERGNRGGEQHQAPVGRPQFNVSPQRFNAPPNVPQGQFVRQERIQQAGPRNYAPDPRQVEAVRAQREQFQRRQQVPGDQYVRYNPYAQSGERFRQADRTRVPVVSNVPREGTQPPMRYENRRGGQVSWNRDWRRDDRYDWRRWRDRHRDRFHIGIYYDPFGWGYQPFSIGWRLWPNYYASSYWITDPWDYQLPYAPPGTQWVRYYNDVLLVDLYSGEVVDVIHDFFW